MDQASPEGVSTPATGASVTTEASAQDTAEPKVETKAESPPADKTSDEQPEVKGVQRRFDELTRLRRDAERDRDHWRDLAQQALRQQQPPPQQAPPEEKEKTLKDFNYDEAAFMRYANERIKANADKEAAAAAERYRAQQDAITRRAKFEERQDAFAKSVEDYHDVVNERTPVSEPMADFLMDSEEAGPLMYYLGNNPDEARKLYYLSPAKAGRELQKLEDRLVAERKKAAAKPVSQAPPPAPQIEGGSAAQGAVKVDTADSDNLSDAEWTKRRNAQERARIRKSRGLD
jgi:hypothetical protein